MKPYVKGILWSIGAIVCFSGAALILLDSMLGSGMCATSIFATNHSPDGEMKARLQMTDCGATTGYSRVVMLEGGRLRNSECRAVALEGEPNVTMKWLSNDVLRITHSASKADLIATEKTCFGRKIELVQG